MRILLIFLFLTFSCSSTKDILLVQDLNDKNTFDVSYSELIIDSDDILRINVFSESPEISQLFNPNQVESNSLTGYQINGYLVDKDGYINLPIIGLIYVKDNTIKQTSVKIQNLLKQRGLLLNSSVDVKIVNSYFTVLGEVNQPGRYNFIENNLNILQAIGIAGDLTINGKRKDVKIIRSDNDQINTKTVDLTNSEFLLSENFQVLPGDVIIVNPNKARVKNAGLINNSGNFLSVLSFILSTLILISSGN